MISTRLERASADARKGPARRHMERVLKPLIEPRSAAAHSNFNPSLPLVVLGSGQFFSLPGSVVIFTMPAIENVVGGDPEPPAVAG